MKKNKSILKNYETKAVIDQLNKVIGETQDLLEKHSKSSEFYEEALEMLEIARDNLKDSLDFYEVDGDFVPYGLENEII